MSRRSREILDPWQIKVRTEDNNDLVLFVVDERSKLEKNSYGDRYDEPRWSREIRIGAVSHQVRENPQERYGNMIPNPNFSDDLAALRSLAEDRAAALNIQ